MRTCKPDTFLDTLKSGDHAVYTEDDWIAEIKILDNESDAEWHKFRVQVVKTIQESSVYKPTKNGHIFHADRRRDYGGCWAMERVPDNKLKESND